MARSKPGSSMTRDFRRKASTPLGWRGNIVANSASRITARSPFRCRSPTIMRAFPIAHRLYLPQDWADDEDRRRRAGVPENIKFATKPEIALEQIAQALKDGVPQGTVLMDAGYGVNTALRDGVTALGLSYVAGILPQTSVWAPDAGPLPPKPWTGQGRPPKR